MTDLNITEVISAINQSGGIPLTIHTVTEQSSFQFWLTIAISGFMILYLLMGFLHGYGKIILSKILIKIFKKSHKIKHLMVIKHTRNELFNVSMIDGSTTRNIQEAMIKFNGEPFDLILYTGGGEIFASEFISRLFKSYNGKIRTFVPMYSMSGGTYLALSTNEIYMNDYACLGGVDAQIGSLFSFGSAKGWNEVIKMKKGKANDQSIIMNMMGKQYTKTMRANVNNLLLDKVPDKYIRENLVDLLTSGNNQHALPLTKEMLVSYGLPIKNIDMETNKKMVKLLKHMTEGVTYG